MISRRTHDGRNDPMDVMAAVNTNRPDMRIPTEYPLYLLCHLALYFGRLRRPGAVDKQSGYRQSGQQSRRMSPI